MKLIEGPLKPSNPIEEIENYKYEDPFNMDKLCEIIILNEASQKFKNQGNLTILIMLLTIHIDSILSNLEVILNKMTLPRNMNLE